MITRLLLAATLLGPLALGPTAVSAHAADFTVDIGNGVSATFHQGKVISADPAKVESGGLTFAMQALRRQEDATPVAVMQAYLALSDTDSAVIAYTPIVTDPPDSADGEPTLRDSEVVYRIARPGKPDVEGRLFCTFRDDGLAVLVDMYKDLAAKVDASGFDWSALRASLRAAPSIGEARPFPQTDDAPVTQKRPVVALPWAPARQVPLSDGFTVKQQNDHQVVLTDGTDVVAIEHLTNLTDPAAARRAIVDVARPYLNDGETGEGKADGPTVPPQLGLMTIPIDKAMMGGKPATAQLKLAVDATNREATVAFSGVVDATKQDTVDRMVFAAIGNSRELTGKNGGGGAAASATTIVVPAPTGPPNSTAVTIAPPDAANSWDLGNGVRVTKATGVEATPGPDGLTITAIGGTTVLSSGQTIPPGDIEELIVSTAMSAGQHVDVAGFSAAHTRAPITVNGVRIQLTQFAGGVYSNGEDAEMPLLATIAVRADGVTATILTYGKELVEVSALLGGLAAAPRLGPDGEFATPGQRPVAQPGSSAPVPFLPAYQLPLLEGFREAPAKTDQVAATSSTEAVVVLRLPNVDSSEAAVTQAAAVLSERLPGGTLGKTAVVDTPDGYLPVWTATFNGGKAGDATAEADVWLVYDAGSSTALAVVAAHTAGRPLSPEARIIALSVASLHETLAPATAR